MAIGPIAVVGGGVSGLAAALLLARDGHRVTVLERDAFEVGPWDESPDWDRRGVPHFLQPHAFIPRGRAELRRHLPDVYEDLLAAGARDVDVARKMPGPVGPEDEDLQYVAVRRPLIEWGLRRAVQAEPRIEMRDRAPVHGLAVERGRVSGVRVDGSVVDAGLVVDALGRRTPTTGWLEEAGVAGEPTETSDCGVVYYCRYYRQRPGFELPDGPWLLSPRGDLGYFAFASFPGDNGTFASVLAVPNGVPEWRVFSQEPAFEAAIARIPMLRQWVDPEGVDPLTGVMPMAGLRNSFRRYDPSVGLVPVGDAFGHTDPVLAHGLAFALIHAAELATACREHADAVDALAAFGQAARPALRERYEFATALDEQRRRLWTGGAVDFTRHDGDYALFSMAAGAAAATVDPDVFRVFVRRIGLLDSTQVLDRDVALRRHIEDIFRRIRASPRPAPGPSREEMLEAANAAAGR